MFKKVLVAEDYESSSLSVKKVLEELQITNADYVYYCDDAMERIKNSVVAKDPFDLLITDLSFEDDYRAQNIKEGKDLIIEARRLLPSLKVIVFSIEKKPKIIENLLNEYEINGFVNKGRGDSTELRKAIETISHNEIYLSTENKKKLQRSNTIELSDVELAILRQLSTGMLQKNIPDYLKQKQMKPCSLSSVEKMINQLKEDFNATNNEQLIAICKDLGLI